MKINCLYIVLIASFLLAVFHGCDRAQEMKVEPPLKEEPIPEKPVIEEPANGTVWKLSGIVDSETGVIKTLAPSDCDACYTLLLDTIEYTITAINIGSRLKLDLKNLYPPMMDDMLRCERYDFDRKDYCDSDFFYRSMLNSESYSITKDEMRLFIQNNHSYLLFIPHKGDNPSTSLRGTKWKLTGIVDVQSGELKELNPIDCADCYTLTFSGDFSFISRSIWAKQVLDLSELDVALDPHSPWGYSEDRPPLFAEEWPVDPFVWKGDGKTYEDSYLFRCGIAYTSAFEFISDKLKLFFVYQEKNYYLLFKLVYK